MTSQSRINVSWMALVIGAVLLLGAGAGGAYLGLRSRTTARPAADMAMPAPGAIAPPSEAASGSHSGPLEDVAITLSADAVSRAGITVSAVTANTATDGLRAPGVVEPNTYKQIIVTPLVGGRLTRVAAQLGQQVKRGQTIAEIFSPELADAQTRYMTARAELEAHEQELARTEKLVTLGAASKQELERIHAEHVSRRAEVQNIASRLRLLGLSAKAIESLGPGSSIDATTAVPAPIDGVVTQRDANVGANVDQSTQLFTIVDLSTVWVVADIFEKDFDRVRVGSPATITTRAYPDLALRGVVSYIDPQLHAETRTAKVRIEVPNPRNELRLGMYADALFQTADGPSTPAIPRTAVQNIGDRTVVYLASANEPGKFVEREVRLGAVAGDLVAVLTGVRSGDLVVTEGGFFLRAERERLGLRANVGAGATTGAPQEAQVKATDSGFEPTRLVLKAGQPARITFTRTSEKTCATAVEFPSLRIRRDLPLNQPVVIEFAPEKGELAFACGMNMFRGTVVVQ
ncbi:MAG TPA: efflux RND transporter periplasmic adaptor subunit [Vicinamibacterales bacterium]|nr:efflux RND transporter periplasmic adaptor subunit [Vicinamibacterales bacterium]